MNAIVTAVVVSHDADDFLSATAKALLAQSRQPNRVVVVDSGSSDGARQISLDSGFDYLKVAQNSTIQESVMAAIEGGESDWFWLVHDDSAPEPGALAALMSAIELSPSVAIAGSKLVQWQNPRIIRQLGLTLTPGGAPFSPIDGQFDQGQNDDIDDVLAVGTAAMLVNVAAFLALGGFDPAAPPLAADIDLGLRARLAGHRVIVVPASRVQHAELSLRGKRDRNWLGASPKTSLRRATIHLRLAYGSMPLGLLYWLFLPLLGVIRAVGQIARKRPELIWSEISAAVWGFFTVARRLSSRKRIMQTTRLHIRELKTLRASRAEVRSARRADKEQDEAFENLSAFERGDLESLTGFSSRGFIASGGLWWAVGLIALSFAWWPKGIAVTAKGLLPLSANWWDLFVRAGSSYQPIGLGFYAPSDPFAWVLTALGGLTFWAPSLSIAVLLLLVKPLAFIGAWKLAAQVSDSTAVRVIAGLGFALWPAFQLAQLDARLPALIAGLALPWLSLAVLRVAQIGRSTKSSAQSWTWVATAGLLLALIAASAPSILPILLLGLGFVALIKIKRIGYLVWVALPAFALFSPTALYYVVGLAHPMALLADPGLAEAAPLAPFLSLNGLIASGGLIVFALLALLRKRIGLVILLWVFAILSLVSAYLISVVQFPAVGVGQAEFETVNGSPAPALIACGLVLSTLAAVAIDGIRAKNLRRLITGLAVAAVVLPSLALSVISRPNLTFSDGRVVPSIVAAEAEQGSTLKLLVLTPSTDSHGHKRLAAELVAGDGVHLDDVSLAYRFSLAKLSGAKYADVAQLVADLVSANGTPLAERLKSQNIGYVLVPSGTSNDLAELGIALDSAPEVEAVGLTDYGRLWRVREAKQAEPGPASSPWSITKGVQVAIILSFVLMAIPSRTTRRRGSEEIFIESGEDAQ
jgi:GT2 family glycosyltransferase